MFVVGVRFAMIFFVSLFFLSPSLIQLANDSTMSFGATAEYRTAGSGLFDQATKQWYFGHRDCIDFNGKMSENLNSLMTRPPRSLKCDFKLYPKRHETLMHFESVMKLSVFGFAVKNQHFFLWISS